MRLNFDNLSGWGKFDFKKSDISSHFIQFVAPEVVNFEAITFATDMWSVGVIAYVL